ncbi:hypothetical protein Poli38472_001195 [Pythium oligandrum]|uniref:Uncharacterized protein n=1 Tax=Pythium oligandrum TaxID=41045 RepID=A0A8K1CT19_PYTOL|nr:hypothetical protein Poli38472_001195 [Pythium oligandrum]|eukprot:TMW69039.1 hypothetical protein Poli38472_001195 [Pythium oligandrum]
MRQDRAMKRPAHLVAMEDEVLQLEEVDEVEYVGRIGGFLKDVYTITLRLYGDQTLEGDVWQPKKPSTRGLGLLSTRKRKHEDDDGNNTETNGSTDTTRVLCASIEGRWLRRRSGHACYFQVSVRAGHVGRQTLSCRVELLTDGTASGVWEAGVNESTQGTNKKGKDANAEVVVENVFEWRRVERSTAASTTTASVSSSATTDPLALYPLAPGTYHFRGFTTHSLPSQPLTPLHARGRRRRAPPPSPARDECLVTMELLPDGSLRGSSREVVYPQSCPIKGTWEVGRVRYILEYRVRDAVGLFKYSGKIDPETEDAHQKRVVAGKWRNVDDNQTTPGHAGGRGMFELECVSAKRVDILKKGSATEDDQFDVDSEPSLRVFTTGSYVLEGQAMDDDGYEYACHVEVELLPDGSLRGTTRESVFHQVQHIRGVWTRTGFAYRQHYVVKDEVGTYWYSGTLDSDGLVIHGQWQNEELISDDEEEVKEDDAQKLKAKSTTSGERGTFSYAILDAKRRWSPQSHRDFPPDFRDCIRCVLLCSQRLHSLPSPLWYRIFAFCGPEWFSKVVDPVMSWKKDVSTVK